MTHEALGRLLQLHEIYISQEENSQSQFTALISTSVSHRLSGQIGGASLQKASEQRTVTAKQLDKQFNQEQINCYQLANRVTSSFKLGKSINQDLTAFTVILQAD